jgi:antitoxin PrlF
MASRIEEISTVTSKGQTTVPKAVRRALGVGPGDKIAFRVEGNRVTVHNADAEHHDPVIAAFLKLLEKDIAAGRNVREPSPELVKAAKRARREIPVDLDEYLDGDVAL